MAEAQRLRDRTTKSMLASKRQNYVRLNQKISSINSVVVSRTRGLVTSTQPYYTTYMESVPQLGGYIHVHGLSVMAIVNGVKTLTCAKRRGSYLYT